MSVSLQNVDKVSALLTVKIEKADYQEKVEKSLKDYRQKAQIPGFRKGMVPLSLVRKMQGKSLLVEEVDRLLSEQIYGYIREHHINILGEPLPNEEKQPPIDFNTMGDFEFVFDLALEPEFTIEFSAKDKVNYYVIEVSDEMVDNQIKTYTQRNGRYDQVESYEENDLLKGVLIELDKSGKKKRGGLKIEEAVIMPSYMKNEEEKAKFNGVKVKDVVLFNPNVAYDGHAAEIASLLKIEKEAAADVKSDFSYQVIEITRFVQGALDQELFDQVYGKGIVKSAEEFRAKIKEDLSGQYVSDSDYKFLLDARKFLVEKVGKLDYSEPLLKRIMLMNNEDKGEAYVAENYDNGVEELTWHLIKDKLMTEANIKVEQADIREMAKEITRAQFARYGMMTVPDDVLENYSQEMLTKKESVDNLVSRVLEVKLAASLKEKVKLTKKPVSIEKFNKMFE